MKPTAKPDTRRTPSQAMLRHPVWAGWGLLALLMTASCMQPAPTTDQVVNVLGQDVAIHYGAEMTDTGRSTVGTALASAASLLDRHAEDLSVDQKHAIAQIRLVYVTQAAQACLGETGAHSMKLSTDYIRATSIPWLASLIGHEGQHFLDAGKYVGADAWKDEQEAGLVQLAIGEKIGFSAAEIRYLDSWTHSGHSVAMQQHMQQGYPRNCDTKLR